MRKLLAPLFVFAALDVVACSTPSDADIAADVQTVCASGNACAESKGVKFRFDCVTVAQKFMGELPERCKTDWSDVMSCFVDLGTAACTSTGFLNREEAIVNACGSQVRRADACFAYTKFMAAMGASETGMPPSGPVN